MDIQELNTVIADFVQVGYMQAVKAYEPPQDFVRVSEVKQWLKMMRIDIKRFNRLVSDGVIRATRKGTGRNSPLYYSKAEIKQALSMANIAGIVARETIK
jgi:hypothetical protein|nr:hypothetical protein [Paraprevotella clara]DAV71971.1 MAG TPA: hypothetical protein [Caudoviricetes sp.]